MPSKPICAFIISEMAGLNTDKMLLILTKGSRFMISRKRTALFFICRFLLVPIVAFALQGVSHAQDLKFLDVEDLTRISTHVFRGEVLSNEVHWTDDHNRIY